ncbi:uncharacterized protein [Lolium perenne]|uniref:uncharacterized protein n=1 Tax=Lolium perenne TaxID=4522 RepID=UPI0021F52D02|nr:uncharacterized protein LOC127295020 [Lolium perenne]
MKELGVLFFRRSMVARRSTSARAFSSPSGVLLRAPLPPPAGAPPRPLQAMRGPSPPPDFASSRAQRPSVVVRMDVLLVAAAKGSALPRRLLGPRAGVGVAVCSILMLSRLLFVVGVLLLPVVSAWRNSRTAQSTKFREQQSKLPW